MKAAEEVAFVSLQDMVHINENSETFLIVNAIYLYD